jgi:hypothetical protein
MEIFFPLQKCFGNSCSVQADAFRFCFLTKGYFDGRPKNVAKVKSNERLKTQTNFNSGHLGFWEMAESENIDNSSHIN